MTHPEDTATLEGCPAASEPRRGKPRAILDAAGELFLAQGYASVSMDAVARKAGVSKATLYAHFPGKDVLFRAMVAERCEEMAADATGAFGRGADLRTSLEGLGAALLRFFTSPRSLGIYRVVLAEAPREPALAEAFYAAGPTIGRARLAAWIAEQQAAGRLRPDADPAQAATHFIALLRGDYWLRAGLGMEPVQDSATLAAEAASAARVFLAAYGAANAA